MSQEGNRTDFNENCALVYRNMQLRLCVFQEIKLRGKKNRYLLLGVKHYCFLFSPFHYGNQNIRMYSGIQVSKCSKRRKEGPFKFPEKQDRC